MVRRSVIVAAAILTLMLAIPSTAVAGGWWTSIDVDQHVATGQKLEFVTKQVLFQSVEEAELAASETFFAYVLQGVDRQMLREAMNKGYSSDWWDPTGARAIKVGTVSIGGLGSNMVKATANIDLTGVEPGAYLLMFCDAGCEHALADLVPTEITVLDSPLLARVANKQTEMRWRIAEIKWELSNRIREGDRQSADRKDVEALSEQVGELQSLVRRTGNESDIKNSGLTNRVSALESNSSQQWLALAWLALGLFIGGLVATLLIRRERRQQILAEDLAMERELLKLQ